jgi:hypothetical protein
MRYGGQLWEGIFSSPVRRIKTLEDLNALLRSFEEEYERRYTRLGMYPEGGLEIITLTLEVYAITPKPILAKRPLQGEDPAAALKGRRKVFFNNEWLDSNVYEMDALNPGNVIIGPSIIEATDTTLVLPQGYKAARDEYIMLLLDRSGDRKRDFLDSHSKRPLNEDEQIEVFSIMESQRMALYMFTSCGWFFDDISGIEAIQVLMYASRAIELVMPWSNNRLWRRK